MGKSANKEIARVADRVQALVAQGLDVAEAYAAARGGSSRLDRELARSQQRHALAVRRHHSWVARQRTRSVTLGAASCATLVIGIIDLAAGAVFGSPLAWLCASAVAGVLAVRARHRADAATEPPVPTPVLARPTDLRRGAVGWAEAQGLAAVRRQIVGLVPAVSGLHPDAGRELARADEQAAPILQAQVTRLAVLDQVVRDLPGSAAATAATTAAEQVRGRLAQGVAVYDRLLAAAASMLASPDLGRSTTDVLGPAADALTAYAYGLSHSAQTFSGPTTP